MCMWRGRVASSDRLDEICDEFTSPKTDPHTLKSHTDS